MSSVVFVLKVKPNRASTTVYGLDLCFANMPGKRDEFAAKFIAALADNTTGLGEVGVSIPTDTAEHNVAIRLRTPHDDNEGMLDAIIETLARRVLLFEYESHVLAIDQQPATMRRHAALLGLTPVSPA